MSESKPLTGFLTQAEKRALQSIYETWLNEVKLPKLLPKLYAAGLVSSFDRQKIDAEQTTLGKAQFIFHEILSRSPYEDVAKIRTLLVATGHKGNIHIAKILPHRNEEIDFTPPIQPEERMIYEQQCTDDNPSGPNILDVVVPEDPMETDAYAKGSGKGIKGFLKPKPKGLVVGLGEKRIVSKYLRRPENGKSPTGKGLCLIIRNFTLDLKGYNEDALHIKRVFGDHLNYEVLVDEMDDGQRLTNLSRQEFENALDKVVAKLSAEDAKYDRFFCFILSHGNDKGIKMCQGGSGVEEEKDTEFPVDEIIDKFTHCREKLPCLRGFPKVFFIQACRGNQVSRAAGTPSISELSDDFKGFHVTPLTVGADVLVCFPSQMGYMSFVPNSGSWFIQHAMTYFENHFKAEHVIDIMGEVANEVGQILRPGVTNTDAQGRGVQESVCQMPHLVSTLTRKFYLYLNPT